MACATFIAAVVAFGMRGRACTAAKLLLISRRTSPTVCQRNPSFAANPNFFYLTVRLLISPSRDFAVNCAILPQLLRSSPTRTIGNMSHVHDLEKNPVEEDEAEAVGIVHDDLAVDDRLIGTVKPAKRKFWFHITPITRIFCNSSFLSS